MDQLRLYIRYNILMQQIMMLIQIPTLHNKIDLLILSVLQIFVINLTVIQRNEIIKIAKLDDVLLLLEILSIIGH